MLERSYEISMSNLFLTTCLGLMVVIAMAGCSKSNAPQAGSLRDAVHLLLDGNAEEALEMCEAILDGNAEHFEAHLLHGEINEVLRRFDDAELAYQEALELRPSSERAQLCLDRLRPATATEQQPEPLEVPELEELAVFAISDPASLDDDTSSEGDTGSANAPPSNDADIGTNHPDATKLWPNNLAKPTSHHLRMINAIEEARRLDGLAREETLCADADEVLTSLDSDTTAPIQVTRFDLSVGGASFPTQGSATRTTGHRLGVSQLPASARTSTSNLFQIPTTRNWAEAARRSAGRC